MAISGNTITVDSDASYTGRVPTVAPSDGLRGQFDDKVNHALQVLLNEALSLTNPNRLVVVRADIEPEASAVADTVLVSVANPFGADAVVYDVILDVTVASGEGTCVLDVGVAAEGTGSDSLIDGGASNAVAVLNNVENKGSNGGRLRTMGAGQFITVQAKVADPGVALRASLSAVIGRK